MSPFDGYVYLFAAQEGQHLLPEFVVAYPAHPACIVTEFGEADGCVGLGAGDSSFELMHVAE